MSTTHSTPERVRRYSIVGTGESRDSARFAVVVLNRGGRAHRSRLFERLSALKPDEIISVEAAEASFTVEGLLREFPSVRFLLMNEPMTPGEQINLAAGETAAGRFLVVWSDVAAIDLPKTSGTHTERPLVVEVPVVRSDRGETLPVVQTPVLQGRRLRVDPAVARYDNVWSVFPFDYVGLYDRERFFQYGTYDPEYSSWFWQKMDFGFRVFLHGGGIRSNREFRVTYGRLPDPEDRTATVDYARFFARNLALRRTGGRVTIPFRAALALMFTSSIGIVSGMRVFRETRRWLSATPQALSVDPFELVQRWEEL